MEPNKLELGKARAAIALGGAELERLTAYPENRWSEVFSGKRGLPNKSSMEKISIALGIHADYLAIAILEKRISNKA